VSAAETIALVLALAGARRAMRACAARARTGDPAACAALLRRGDDLGALLTIATAAAPTPRAEVC
jgi:hypothetical protein